MKIKLTLIAAFALAAVAGAHVSLAAEIASCTASFNGSELIIRNSRVERRWRVANGLLYATSLRDLKTQAEWLARPSSQPAPFPPSLASTTRELVFSERRGKSNPVEQQALTVELSAKGSANIGYRFRVFPDASGISVQLLGAPAPAPSPSAAQPSAANVPTGIEAEGTPSATPADILPDTLEVLDLAPRHLKLTQVNLFDQTDVHNELVSEREWLLHTAESLQLEGNLFTLEDPLTGHGLIFLKEAPLPHARPQKSDHDLAYDATHHRIALTGNSIGPGGSGYRLTTLTYSGGRRGITEVLHEYQRQVRPYVPGRDGMFVSNTWGDRSQDSRINDKFMRGEAAAGSQLGVDVIQIDDGWQQGRSKNSTQAGGVWNGFWAADPGFWNVNRQRFPEGLEPIIDLARQRNMGFGLWFAPDSSNDFSNWERDAARLLELHRSLGISYFKIDGVKATSKLSEERLRAFFDRVQTGSEGRVVFDLDVTAEIRPGYFGAMNVGPLFVENRYTDRHRYWPHQTLRNLWKLSQYVDPLRLRIEFLNNARNAKLYPDDPMAPSEYSPAYLFATTMMANPLGWFELSGLPRSYFEQLAPMIATWKKERANMQGGRIFPIGLAPDGATWTGFVSLSERDKGGYLLVFRERNQSGRWSESIPALLGRSHTLQLLAGAGSGSVANGTLDINIPHQLGFAWFRLAPPE